MKEGSKDIIGIKILLLEDEIVLADLYSKKLTEAGFQVRVHANVDGLLEQFEDFDPDVAFLDYSLRGDDKSGIDIIPILKKKKPAILIVMLSNYSEFQMEKRAKEAGAVDYLLKINTPPALLVEYTKKLARKLFKG